MGRFGLLPPNRRVGRPRGNWPEEALECMWTEMLSDGELRGAPQARHDPRREEHQERHRGGAVDVVRLGGGGASGGGHRYRSPRVAFLPFAVGHIWQAT